MEDIERIAQDILFSQLIYVKNEKTLIVPSLLNFDFEDYRKSFIQENFIESEDEYTDHDEDDDSFEEVKLPRSNSSIFKKSFLSLRKSVDFESKKDEKKNVSPVYNSEMIKNHSDVLVKKDNLIILEKITSSDSLSNITTSPVTPKKDLIENKKEKSEKLISKLKKLNSKFKESNQSALQVIDTNKNEVSIKSPITIEDDEKTGKYDFDDIISVIKKNKGDERGTNSYDKRVSTESQTSTDTLMEENLKNEQDTPKRSLNIIKKVKKRSIRLSFIERNEFDESFGNFDKKLLTNKKETKKKENSEEVEDFENFENKVLNELSSNSSKSSTPRIDKNQEVIFKKIQKKWKFKYYRKSKK
jgi:hypothetical protein